jgi:hypothetical protein
MAYVPCAGRGLPKIVPRRHEIPVTASCRLLILVMTVVLPLAMMVGCGGGSALIDVNGVVTLDGDPLPAAMVVFTPARGRSSHGTTDAAGAYRLSFTNDLAGALPGEHAVSIATGKADGNEDARVPSKDRLPSRYNAKTTLKVTVDASHSKHDFSLDSK